MYPEESFVLSVMRRGGQGTKKRDEKKMVCVETAE
jgi:hypothetical protein